MNFRKHEQIPTKIVIKITTTSDKNCPQNYFMNVKTHEKKWMKLSSKSLKISTKIVVKITLWISGITNKFRQKLSSKLLDGFQKSRKMPTKIFVKINSWISGITNKCGNSNELVRCVLEESGFNHEYNYYCVVVYNPSYGSRVLVKVRQTQVEISLLSSTFKTMSSFLRVKVPRNISGYLDKSLDRWYDQVHEPEILSDFPMF